MFELQRSSCVPHDSRPRHPHQEIADLLAVALLRLRVASTQPENPPDARVDASFSVAMSGYQSVNANLSSTSRDGK